jgi:hypothetical protein
MFHRHAWNLRTTGGEFALILVNREKVIVRVISPRAMTLDHSRHWLASAMSGSSQKLFSDLRVPNQAATRSTSVR